MTTHLKSRGWKALSILGGLAQHRQRRGGGEFAMILPFALFFSPA